MTNFSDDFNKAMDRLLDLEGRHLTNDPDDPGGITICGISKVHNPDWEGWALIDMSRMDDKAYIKQLLVSGGEVMNAVYRKYKISYWDIFHLDDHEYILANRVFDIAVNLGPKWAATFMQQMINALNYENKNGADLVVDGKYGPITKGRLASCVEDGRTLQLAHGMASLQGHYYVALTEKNAKRKKYLAGWLRRVYEKID